MSKAFWALKARKVGSLSEQCLFALLGLLSGISAHCPTSDPETTSTLVDREGTAVFKELCLFGLLALLGLCSSDTALIAVPFEPSLPHLRTLSLLLPRDSEHNRGQRGDTACRYCRRSWQSPGMGISSLAHLALKVLKSVVFLHFQQRGVNISVKIDEFSIFSIEGL